MRALAVAGIVGLFVLTAIFSLRDSHSGRGYQVYYMKADGNIGVSAQRHSQLRHR
jgi:hypothetical protein